MQALGVAHPFFVRCIKPNMKKTSETFDAVVVMNQLRYSGMLETVRIRRTGYPVRRTFADFLYRYKVLTITVGGVASNLKADAKLRCQTVLSSIDSAGTNWQLGLTKIFLRESLEATLEKTRQQALQAVANKIKSRIMGYIQRKRFLKAKRNVVVVQKLVRGFLARRRFRKAVAAAIVIQTNFRGFSARKLRAKLLEIKRIEEEKRKAEERRKEEERRREMERLEKENKMRELEELRRKAEQEAKQRAEEEAAKKAAAAKEQAEAAAKARVLAERLEAEEKERKRLEAERIEAELAEAQRKAEEAAYIAERDAVLQELNDLGNDEGALQEDMISLSSSISGGASHQGGGGGGSAADGARKDSAARDSIFSNEEEEEDDGGEEGEEGEAIDIDFEALKLLREGTMYRHSDTKVKKSWKRK